MPVSPDPRIGTELLGYRIEALVGRGGMGVVYRAYDPRLKRNVALKLIDPELSGDARFRERFLAETELAASLEHPNVVPIYDAGEIDGRLYIAMRYVEGVELKRLLQDEGALEPARALAICGQVAAALDAAHERGLVHRDVKPSNVLLDEAEHTYLADFGLSRRLADDRDRAEGEGVSVGTPAYVSPEQIEGAAVNGRADLYALGCLLYECLTGQAPFQRDSELAVLWAHIQEPPPAASEHNPDLPEEIDPVLAGAMAKNPDDRYASCGGLVVAAREALGLHPPAATRNRKAVVITAVGVALVAAAVIAGVLLSQRGGPGRPSTKPTLTPKVDSLQRIDPKTNKLIATRPGAIRGFLSGWFDTIALMRADKGKTVDTAMKVLDLDRNIAERSYDTLMPMFSDDGRFSPKALSVLARSYVDLKFLPSEPDMSKLYTEDFLPKR